MHTVPLHHRQSPAATRRPAVRIRFGMALVAATALALTGCGGAGIGGTDSNKVDVAVSFYPLQYLTENIGGDLVSVKNLTPPGAESHDLELTARDAATLGEMDLVIYQGGGFQPTVEQAVEATAASVGFDVTDAARLTLAPPAAVDLSAPAETPADDHAEDGHTEEGHAPEEAGHADEGAAGEAETPAEAPAEEHAEDDHDHGASLAMAHLAQAAAEGEHADEGHTGEEAEHEDEDAGHADDHDGEVHDHDHGTLTVDPHFWLDPLRMADVGDAIAARLVEIDPENTETYTANAANLRADLTGLDAEFTQGLQTCQQRTILSSHASFGYLADRYNLNMISVSGLNPNIEPKPQSLAQLSDYARRNGISVIYYERLVSPTVAQAIAKEAGAITAVLDPLEGLTDESAGNDYRQVMRSNLNELRQQQGCS